MTFATLDVRGPCKLSDIDFALTGLVSDGSFDLSYEEANGLYHSLRERGIGLEMVEFFGPAGGNPCVTLYGTAEAIIKYLKEDYLVGDEDDMLPGFLARIEKV